MINKLLNTLLDPYPHRSLIIRLIQKYKLGTYEQRLRIGAVKRPHYGYCVYNSAKLAVKLGVQQISVLEFGVAGGNGLLNLEYHVQEVEKILPVKINLFGFDTGSGLPRPQDYRDLPHRFAESNFKMDFPVLKAKLKLANLVIGDVSDTVTDFFKEYNPSPIAAIIFDLDFYSSTIQALKIFDVDEKYLVPRIFCYFDDVIGTEAELYNDYVGERLAIQEFNQKHDMKKIANAYHLVKQRVLEKWHHKIFIYHDFSHSLYNNYIGTDSLADFTLTNE